MNDYNQMRGGFVQFIGIGLSIIALITTIAKFILRHPFILKMMIFSLFVGLIGSMITFILGKASGYIVSNEITGLLAYFGILQALALFISILLAGFGTKQILAFVRST